MKDTLKVNVEFQLEVPIEYNEAGHRKNPVDLVAPWIDDFMTDVRFGRMFVKCGQYRDPVDSFDKYKDILDNHFADDRALHLRMEANRIEHEKQYRHNMEVLDNYYKDLLGVTYDAYWKLSFYQRKELMDRMGVVTVKGELVRSGSLDQRYLELFGMRHEEYQRLSEGAKVAIQNRNKVELKDGVWVKVCG